MSSSLQPHGLQHTRLLCPPLPPGICSNSCTLSQSYCLTISSSATPFCFAFNLSHLRVFSNESALPLRWSNYWSFNFSISPSNEYSGLISFRIDWFDLLAVQGTLKRLLQCHNSKASVLWHSAFFMVQLLPAYMATGKTNFDYADFVGKVMSLLFNTLSSLSELSFQGARIF